MKRVYTGLIFGMVTIIAMLAGPLYMWLLMSVCGLGMFREITTNLRDTDKDELIGVKKIFFTEWILYIMSTLFIMPRIFLTRSLLNASGITEKDFPIIFSILHTHNHLIILALGALMIPWFVLFMQRGAYRYQLIRFGFASIGAVYVSMAIATTSAISLNGRVWIFFALSCSQFNDAFAYFVGVSFGKTPLI